MMKNTKIFTLLAAGLALSLTASAANTTVKLSGVHLCCNSCVKGVEKAIATVKGVTAVVDKDGQAVALTAPDKAVVQQGIDAIVEAGYFGASDNPSLKAKAAPGGKEGKVSSLNVEGVHLCCAKCVKAVNEAVGKVKGVKGTNAEKNAKSFEVTGEFQAKDIFAALQKAGLSGKAGK
ncbi:MAG TPA: hypothetical protein VI454_04605 [Verrucomicrobiae bacterium]|jgi:copper chaperone CopZ